MSWRATYWHRRMSTEYNLQKSTKIDLEETCSTDQSACRLKAGVEGAIHVLSDVFDDNKENGCGMLLMDASNAFN